MQIVISATQLQRIHSKCLDFNSNPSFLQQPGGVSKRSNVARSKPGGAGSTWKQGMEDRRHKENLEETQRCVTDAMEEEFQAQQKRLIIERANMLMYVSVIVIVLSNKFSR